MYSVVIPTMGRECVEQAICSVLDQSVKPEEIIVVAGRKIHLSKSVSGKVTLINKQALDTKRWSAAHNRNLGISICTSKYVALLDDDDCWLPHKMKTQLRHLEESPNTVSISSAKYVPSLGKNSIRPKYILNENQDILNVLYGKKLFFRQPFYFPTPGIVLETRIAKTIKFDETLPTFEDIWWLHELQVNNLKLEQISDVLVIVNANPIRSIKKRDTFKSDEFWADRLSGVESNYGRNYLYGICLRNNLVTFQLRNLYNLLKKSFTLE